MSYEERLDLQTRLANDDLDLTDEDAAALLSTWEFWARPDQLTPTEGWRIWLILAGRGWGKTRTGGEWVREQVKTFKYVNLVAPTADDARDIMVEGESGILAICPEWERPEYLPSKRLLKWPNGARSLIFTADEPERLRGKQHQKVWADELFAWKYQDEAWAQILLGLRLPPDPQILATSTPKPTRLLKSLRDDPTCVITRGSTYDNLENLASVFKEEVIKRYEGTRLGRQELHAEILDTEGLAYAQFQDQIHVVRHFDIPNHWDRFEFMDFGSSAPTAWYPVAVDFDGNMVVFDEFYEPGLPSQTAPVIKRKRAESWCAKAPNGSLVRHPVWGDPSIFNGRSVTSRFGREATVSDEFNDCGIFIDRANNDRKSGYIRISELLTGRSDRKFPEYHPRAGEKGAPMLFFTEKVVELVKQLKDAPLEDEKGRFPGEAVDADWEGPHGHAHAALRYGVLSRPAPAHRPHEIPSDQPSYVLEYLRGRYAESWAGAENDTYPVD